MSFGSYISSIYTLMGLGGLVLTGAFAWWKGGPPERLGTLMLAVSWIVADVARAFSAQMVPTITLLGTDFLTAACFLYIAIRYSSLWLGVAMILRATGFAVHAAQLSSPDDQPRWHGWIVYLLINNILAYLVLLTLIGGTIATILHRGRVRREMAQTEAKTSRRAGVLTAPPQPPATAT